MTLAGDLTPWPAEFGAGGGEPYARALRSTRRPRLYLHEVLGGGRAASRELDLQRWSGAADAIDIALLSRADGPVLDVGCGPGRMVRAALDLGLEAWGIDVSATAVEDARAAGLPVLRRSVFDRLPDEGRWRTVLLVDGNIGIGGDVESLLRRCAELLHPDGEIVIEAHPDAEVDRRYTGRLTDREGRSSGEFPWADAGAAAIERHARLADLALAQTWSAGGRAFCRLVSISR